MPDHRLLGRRPSRVTWILAAAGLGFILLVIACSDSPSEPSGGQPAVNVARVDLSPTAGTLAALGDTIRFQAQAFNAQGGAVAGVSFTWSSANPQVATVTSTGLVTAVSNGATEIRAQAQQVTGAAAMTVVQQVAGIVMSSPRDTLTAIGDTVRLSALAVDARENPVDGVPLSWTSSDPEVGSIDTTGLVTAVSNGTTTITAVAETAEATHAITIGQVGETLVIQMQPSGARAGLALEVQPVLRIVDGNGATVSTDDARDITATVTSGSGTLEGAVATAAAGVVTFADLTIGGPAGPRILTFSGEGLTSADSESFELEPGLPATLTVESGDGATGLADTEVALAARLADSYDNGVPGVAVSWTVIEGDGSPSAGETPTDQAGVASVDYRLGRFAGVENVAGTAAGLAGSPVTFTLTATPNATISGTVTLTNELLSASLSQQQGGVGGGGLVRPGGAGGHRPPLSLQPGHDAQSVLPTANQRRSAGPEYVPGELLVTFHAHTLSAPQIGSLAYRSGATARIVSEGMRASLATAEAAGDVELLGTSPAILVARVRVRSDAGIDAVERALQRNPRIAHVERHRMQHASRDAAQPSVSQPTTQVLSNDPLYPWQAWHYHMIDLPRGWGVTTGSASVVVAVVDDGIRFDHPDIAANLTADGYDFVANNDVYAICSGGSIGRAGDGDGYDPDPTTPVKVTWNDAWACIEGVETSGGHGLHVAGTIGAVGGDGVGVTGVNWNVSIRPVRVLDIRGSGSVYDIAQGILYAAGLPADDGAGGTVTAPTAAHIINMSFGGPANTVVQENAIAAAAQAGSLLVAAAGNDGSDEARYPAAYPEVISVSAVGPDRSLAPYSSFGSTIDVAAPGGDVSFGCSFGIVSTTWNFLAGEPTYDCQQGTSMAAPHVAGVAALLLAAEPGLTPTQLRGRLLDFAVPAGPGNLYGAGIVNARNSLTRTMAPARALYARLIDASTGATIATAPAPSGSYGFTELADGEYYVYAGQDEEGDGIIGIPVRRWGTQGGAAKPSSIAVSGAGEYPASFQLGFPIEGDPNSTLADADLLPIGGYLLGTIVDPNTEVDVMRVHIPAAGTYTFETSAVTGACGFALGEDTVLGLYDSGGNIIAFNENIDENALNYCSRLSENLSVGVYYLGVFGTRGGLYALTAREGS
jgi:subtilisin family serine protease